jgi:transposase
VTSAYLEQVLQAIDRPPRDLGLSFSNWTTKNLAAYMGQQTGIVIRARQMENYLKAHDWRLRRPVRTIKHHQDPEQVEAKKKSN